MSAIVLFNTVADVYGTPVSGTLFDVFYIGVIDVLFDEVLDFLNSSRVQGIKIVNFV